MLKIVIPEWEDYDPIKEKFITGQETVLYMEHSLVSISEWESKYHKPYLRDEQMTPEEFEYYIRCMILDEKSSKYSYETLRHMTDRNLREISDYINDPMTATTITRRKEGGGLRKQIITSELIYYWMISCEIPFECQNWHINRLLMLIEVVSIKNQKPEKMSRKDAASQYRSLNKARKAKHHTKG